MPIQENLEIERDKTIRHTSTRRGAPREQIYLIQHPLARLNKTTCPVEGLKSLNPVPRGYLVVIFISLFSTT